MGRGKILSLEEITAIKAYKDMKLSNREIALKLNRSPKVINNFFKSPESYGKNWSKVGNKKLDERAVRGIMHPATNKKMTASEIKAQMELPVTTWRVQQILQLNPNTAWRKRAPKPKITQKHSEARLAFAEKHMAWTNEWRRVVFTDEKKFNLDRPDGLQC